MLSLFYYYLPFDLFSLVWYFAFHLLIKLLVGVNDAGYEFVANDIVALQINNTYALYII